MAKLRKIIDKLTDGLHGDAAVNDNALSGDHSSVRDVAAPSQSRADMAANYPLGRTTYIVQEGDTLESIAAANNIGAADLAGINNMVNPNVNLYPGRALIIPS